MSYPGYNEDQPGTSKRAAEELRRRLSLDDHVKESIRAQEEMENEERIEAATPKTPREIKMERMMLYGADKSRFCQINFTKACRIIRAIRDNDTKLPRPSFVNDAERVVTYDLAVCVLKYSEFIDEALMAAEFYKKFPYYKTIVQEEVIVVAYDLLERDFSLPKEDSKFNESVKSMQRDMLTLRTRIMANIARLRIKADAVNMEGLLPENLRHQHNVDQNSVYAWVNLIRTNIKDVVARLKQEVKLDQATCEDDLLIQENSFFVDKTYHNLIRFHSSCHESLVKSYLIRNFLLVIQDKSACLVVYSLVKAIYFKEHVSRGRNQIEGPVDINILNEYYVSQKKEQDFNIDPVKLPWYEDVLITPGAAAPDEECVIVTHCGSGRTVAHLAVLLQTSVPTWILNDTNTSEARDLVESITSRFSKRPPFTIITFGIPKEKTSDVHFFMRRDIGAMNVKMYNDSFTIVTPRDSRVKGALAILVNPPSSGSALKDPVKYICNEGGEEEVLLHMTKLVNNHHTNMSRGQDRTHRPPHQRRAMLHALHYPAKLIMYTTFSILKSENAEVVSTSVSQMRKELEVIKNKHLTDLVMKKNVRAFKDTTFQYIKMNEILYHMPLDLFMGPFLELPPSSKCSGLFLGLLRRRDDTITVTKTVVTCDSVTKFKTPSQLLLASTRTRTNPSADTSDAESVSEYKPVDLADSIYTKQGISEYLRNIGTLNNPPVLATVLESLKEATPKEGLSGPGPKVTLMVPDNDAGAKEKLKSKEVLYKFGRKSEIQLKEAKKRKKAKQLLKKANLLERLAVPTHSSMAKQKEKWQPADSKNKMENQPGPSSAASASSTSTTRSRSSADAKQSGSTAHPPESVCTRHAHKFPDFKP